MSIERRKSYRITDYMPIKLYKTKGFVSTLGKDISMLGIRVECDEKFDVGQEFLFEIFLSNGKAIKSKGKIVWSKFKENKYYYGIKFFSMNILNKLKLLRLIRIIKKMDSKYYMKRYK